MTTKPGFLAHFALAEGTSHNSGAKAVDATLDLMNAIAPAEIPDQAVARDALDAWGIRWEEGGEGIQRMLGTVPTLRAHLPSGWRVENRGNSHYGVRDDRGRLRLRWFLHGWDPISVQVEHRFRIRGPVDLGPSEAVYQVFDGEVVIHTVPFEFPHARIDDRTLGDSEPYWTLPESAPSEQGSANYTAHSNAREQAADWLRTHRPKALLSSLESWED